MRCKVVKAESFTYEGALSRLQWSVSELHEQGWKKSGDMQITTFKNPKARLFKTKYCIKQAMVKED